MMKSSQNTLLHVTSRVAFLLAVLVLLVVQPVLAQSNKGENTGVAHRLKKLEQLVGQLQAMNSELQTELEEQGMEIENLKGQLAQEMLARQALESKLQYVSVVQEPINGLSGPHLIVEGCNLHVRSGSGDSTDGTVDWTFWSEIPDTTPTGLGNLVVGYNEVPVHRDSARTGSHNIILGPGHDFTSVGSAVFGQENSAAGPFSGVSGGYLNNAGGYTSSVSGGAGNVASGVSSSVSGGVDGTASNFTASVSGGPGNTASGSYSSVSGGTENEATFSSASVNGGYLNTASGFRSCVSGGSSRTAAGELDWVAGELIQDQ